VEACTVTALDAITAFAVPDPNATSQATSVFSGQVARTSYPAERITQPTLDRQPLLMPTLSAVDVREYMQHSAMCQRPCSVQQRSKRGKLGHSQIADYGIVTVTKIFRRAFAQFFSQSHLFSR